jgi:hypothetical protein
VTRTLIVLSLAGALCVAGCSARSTPPARALTEERMQQLIDPPKAPEVAENEARQDDLRQRVRLWQPQLEKYRECNNHAANGIALRPGDPLSLATAARAMCSHYEVELQSALVAAYADIPGVGEHALQRVRQTTLEYNVAEIVAARAMAQPHQFDRLHALRASSNS